MAVPCAPVNSESQGVGVATAADFAVTAAADGEMCLAVRGWTGGLRLQIGEQPVGFSVTSGEISAGVPEPGAGVVTVAGASEVWASLLTSPPPRFAQIPVLVAFGDAGLQLGDTDPVLFWQYLPALERAVELLRGEDPSRPVTVAEDGALPRHDSPVGRYVHLEIDGLDHRIYYESAGEGIPVLLQHTAGAHGSQYRHLFEMPEITDRFRLIAYDLPYHGKSIPPVHSRWWERPYRLVGAWLRQVPVALSRALELDRPAFMGCSVGGLLALDLALRCPDDFRAVIALEGALHVGGDPETFVGMWHPQVSNHSKARMMEGLCGPASPEPYVKEVSQVYSAGWPPAFLGDLHYYMVEHDIRDQAHEIDTTRVGVHILNGSYDYTATVEAGRAAHEAIAGSTHTEMGELGHFPMQEHPQAFAKYLLPILDQIAADSSSSLDS